jgi:hypothetical protein
VHAALEVQDPARSESPSRTLSSRPSTRWWLRGEAWLWLAALLVVTSLSLADGLLANVVAYERDTTVFYFPLLSWVSQQLKSGHFPLWTPQFFGGYPIFADGETGLSYPPVLLALLSLPADRAFIALRVFHLCLAATGMFVLARAWRLPYAAAALAGLTFALGNFLQAQIHHENVIRTASWLPLILALTEYALVSETWRPRLRWVSLATLALGLAGLSLHSQVLAMELMVLAGYAAMRWAIGPLPSIGFAKRRWQGRFAGVARVCLPLVLVGFGLAAVQVLPLLELASFSARGNGIPYDQSAAYSVTPLGLLQAVFPYLFRGPGSMQWGLWTHWESYVYIGLVPLLLTVVALVCVRRREIAGWAAMGGLGLVLSLGQYSPINLHYLLWLLPGLSGLRAPGRFTLVVDLAGAMLAAFGLAWLIAVGSDPVGRQRLRRALLGLSAATGLMAVLLGVVHAALTLWPGPTQALIGATYLAVPRDSYTLTPDMVWTGLSWATDARNPRVLFSFAGLTLALAALWQWQYSKRWNTWPHWPHVLLALTAIDLLVFGWGIHPREPLGKISAEPAAVRALENLPSPDAAPNRVLASPVLNQVAADSLAPFGSLQEANGYSSLEFIWHRDYLGHVLYVDDTLLDLWGVRYVLDPAQFGSLSSFDDVQFLPEQALLQSPSGGALAREDFALNQTAPPIVEVRFVTALMGAVDVPQNAPVAQVELHDASGNLVATAELQAGRDTMDWAWDVPSVQASIQHQRVQTAGTTTENDGPQPNTRNLSFADFTLAAPTSAATMTVRAVQPAGEFVLYGAALVRSDGSLEQLFGKTKTKYRPIYADDQIRVLENTAAFPRAFVVPNATVAPSLGSALSAMVHQPFQPDQDVILADDTTTHAAGLPGARGGHGSAQVTSYSSDAVTVRTLADADAWLVLSDTYYPGWTATVDGQPTSVMRGDVLFRVVPIPAGQHEVQFRFQPTSVWLGLSISALALVLVLIGLGVAAGGQMRRRRTT